MPIPAAITSAVSTLNTAILAAGDLDTASFDTMNDLAWLAGQTASAVEASISATAGALDTFTAPLMPQDIAAGFLALVDASTTQTALADLEGFIARVEINLENRT